MDQSRSSGPLWLASLGLAALATWICFDAMPGINWLIWTAAAAGALVFFTRMRRPVSSDTRSATFLLKKTERYAMLRRR